jgi:acyl-CoA thioester hydrolase
MAEAGFAIFLRKHQVQYLQPALLGDALELSTWAYDIKRSTATRAYAIRRAGDGTLLAQVNSLGVWVDLATGRPIRIPADLMADFAPNLVTDHRTT